MKSFFLASLLVVAVSASLLEEHGNLFQSFKLAHGKTYKNQVEESKRFAIFRENLRSIEEHNALYEQGLETYKKAVNQFADMTHEEFKARLGYHQKPALNKLQTVPYVKKGIQVPEAVDWRDSQVTSVRDQGTCGSCWAFSLTGSTEAAFYRKNGTLVNLSEQQLIDCTLNFIEPGLNGGCKGGVLEDTFPYIQHKGLQSEDSYPYIGYNDVCQYNESEVVTRIDKYVTIYKDEEALLEAVATVGPVSIAMDASFLNFYFGGIYSSFLCSPSGLNHGVLIVGYGSENGKDYWIVKNSWGRKWGEKGYFKIARGKNMCGVAEDTVYPIIN